MRLELKTSHRMMIVAYLLVIASAIYLRVHFTPNYTWPVDGRVSSDYNDWRGWFSLHQGIDIAASYGADVLATEDGVVEYSGNMKGYGLTVIIKHQKISALYAHFSKIKVQRGDKVEKGGRIGQVGSTGNAKRPHLHFETRDLKGKYLNPVWILP